MSAWLQDEVAFVTGGSRGLGAAICEALARDGAKVGFCYAQDTEGAARTLARIEALGGVGSAQRASVTDPIALDAAVRAVAEDLGPIGILVNNAGISQPLPFALLDPEDWDQVMDTNAKGTYHATRAVLRGMIRQRRGVILNIGSLAGLRLVQAPVHYAASKAAIKGFTEALAKDMARHGIRVNCLAPGLLDQGLGRNLPEHRLADYVDHVAMGRVGTTTEVARFAAFLVSGRNSYMTGATILMDGGL